MRRYLEVVRRGCEMGGLSESQITRNNGFNGEGGRWQVESERSCLNSDLWDFLICGSKGGCWCGKSKRRVGQPCKFATL